jgi:hypothetical protein
MLWLMETSFTLDTVRIFIIRFYLKGAYYSVFFFATLRLKGFIIKKGLPFLCGNLFNKSVKNTATIFGIIILITSDFFIIYNL